MGSLRRRLQGLEEKQGIRQREPSEEELKRRWLEKARHRRHDDLSDWKQGYGQVRDIIRTLRLQGRMASTTEGLRNQLLAWNPPHDPEVIEREIARFIFAQEEGTESMVCPPAWRKSLKAAEELRERNAAVPDEVLARWAVMQHELEEVEKKIAAEGERFGITEELGLKAIGPDAEQITDEERRRRLLEILADNYYTERGWRLQRCIDQLIEERP